MKKILIAVSAIILFLFAGATIFVHLYLTDEKIKTLVIPPAEKALGRKVEIGAISVSIFSGIEINDLTIAEADGRNPFARVNAFVLRYRLLPLLRKKIEIDRIIIKRPILRISRDADRKFNFSTLAVLEKTPEKKPSPPDSGGMPMAVKINRMSVEDGQVLISDKSGEIPATEINCNLDLDLELNRDRPEFKGSGDILLKSVYGAINPVVQIRADFDQDKLKAVCDLALEGQKLKLTARVKNYQTEPEINFLLAADRLNADKLIALGGKLPEPAPGKTKIAAGKVETAAPPELPPVKGKVTIAGLRYRDLPVDDLAADLHSDGNRIFLDTLGLKTAGGTINAEAALTLNDPMTWEGNINIKGIEAARLKKGLRLNGGGIADGSITLKSTFSGRGTQWPALADRLAARGAYRLARARITRNQYTELLALVLKNPELAELTASDLKGDFTIKKGRLFLDATLAAREITLSSNGSIGLAALDLDFPVQASLPPETADKTSPEIRKLLTDNRGRLNIGFKVSGNAGGPRIRIDKKAMKKAAKKQIKKQAAGEAEKLISKELGNRPEADLVRSAADSLLNGLFGGNK